MTGSSPAMLSDAHRFFTSHGLAGFTPGQFTVNEPAKVAASCSAASGGSSSKLAQDETGGFNVNTLEEAIDVESVHVTAPAAKIVYVAAGCQDTSSEQQMQNMLDAETRVVDQHLADVATGSFDNLETMHSPAGGASIDPPFQTKPSVDFPGSSPWATTVGGTSLEIGRGGEAIANVPWGDNATQVDTAGTGYTAPPPGTFLEGSAGGLSAMFAEPAYQKSAVPAALTAGGGAGGRGRRNERRLAPVRRP